MNKCILCKSEKIDDLKYGKFYQQEKIGVHYYCLLLTSNLLQNGKDNQGILGFLVKDIIKESQRIKNQVCFYCRKLSAHIGCCAPSCRRTFHFICGLEKGAENQFSGTYRSFCDRDIPKTHRKKPQTSDTCSICLEHFSKEYYTMILQAPCCKNGWFHKWCLQKSANNSGYFFKCPLCNNKDKFKSEIALRGIFIPDKDADWELGPNAFAELAQRPDRCTANSCLCEKGREFINENKFSILYCDDCGSEGIHKICKVTDIRKNVNKFICSTCKVIANKFASNSSSNLNLIENRDSGNNIYNDENDFINVESDSDEDIIDKICEPNIQNVQLRPSKIEERRHAIQSDTESTQDKYNFTSTSTTKETFVDSNKLSNKTKHKVGSKTNQSTINTSYTSLSSATESNSRNDYISKLSLGAKKAFENLKLSSKNDISSSSSNNNSRSSNNSDIPNKINKESGFNDKASSSKDSSHDLVKIVNNKNQSSSEKSVEYQRRSSRNKSISRNKISRSNSVITISSSESDIPLFEISSPQQRSDKINPKSAIHLSNNSNKMYKSSKNETYNRKQTSSQTPPLRSNAAYRTSESPVATRTRSQSRAVNRNSKNKNATHSSVAVRTRSRLASNTTSKKPERRSRAPNRTLKKPYVDHSTVRVRSQFQSLIRSDDNRSHVSARSRSSSRFANKDISSTSSKIPQSHNKKNYSPVGRRTRSRSAAYMTLKQNDVNHSSVAGRTRSRSAANTTSKKPESRARTPNRTLKKPYVDHSTVRARSQFQSLIRSDDNRSHVSARSRSSSRLANKYISSSTRQSQNEKTWKVSTNDRHRLSDSRSDKNNVESRLKNTRKRTRKRSRSCSETFPVDTRKSRSTSTTSSTSTTKRSKYNNQHSYYKASTYRSYRSETFHSRPSKNSTNHKHTTTTRTTSTSPTINTDYKVYEDHSYFQHHNYYLSSSSSSSSLDECSYDTDRSRFNFKKSKSYNLSKINLSFTPERHIYLNNEAVLKNNVENKLSPIGKKKRRNINH